MAQYTPDDASWRPKKMVPHASDLRHTPQFSAIGGGSSPPRGVSSHASITSWTCRAATSLILVISHTSSEVIATKPSVA